MQRPPLDSWQYRIGPNPDGPSPDGSNSNGAIPVGRHWLAVEQGLPVAQITDAAGRRMGVLLGFAIDLKTRRIIDQHWQAPVALGDDPDGFALAVLRTLGGLFLWAFDTGSGVRLYPDSSAQVPCVFDRDAQIAGSSAHALFDDTDYEARFDHPLYDRLGVDGEGWFPGGLTAHRGVNRILSGHYLDLEDWQVRRFWPHEPISATPDPEAALAEITRIVQAQIEALAAGPKRLAMALTAGHETRMLLACAQPWLDKIDFVTVSGGDRHKTDTVMARHIAGDLGLSHIQLPRLEASEQERDLFIRRGGHCNADSNATYHPSVWPLAQTHVFAGGLGGEIARAFLWRDADRPDTRITPALLTGRFGLPPTPELTEALERWLDDVQGLTAYQILDLAYMEHRNSAWYAVQFCSDPTLVRQAPLLTYRACELMLSLPPEWKRENKMGHHIIDQLCPELHRYPYNSLGTLSDMKVKLQRVLSDPRVLLKKLRKMRA